MSIQPGIVSRIVFRLTPFNKRKTNMFLKIILFGSLKNLTKFEYFLHLLCKQDEVCFSSNLKKIGQKDIFISHKFLRVNLHIP